MITDLIHFIRANPIESMVLAMFAYFLFSNAVGAMEEPDPKSGKLYRYSYKFLHGLAGNLRYALRFKAPQYVPPEEPPKP